MLLILAYPTLSLCKPDSNSSLNVDFFFYSIKDIYDSRHVVLIGTPVICMVFIAMFLIGINCNSSYTFRFVAAVFFIAIMGLSIYFIAKPNNITGYSRIIGIVLLVILLLIAFLVYRYWSSLQSALQLLDIASQFIKSHNYLVIMFIIKFILWACCMAIWLGCYFLIYSISDSQKIQTGRFAYLTSLTHNLFIQICLYLTVVHLVWTTLFILNAGSFLTCCTASNWLVNRASVGDYEPGCDFFNNEQNFSASWRRLIRFHHGSVFVGAVLVSCFSWLSSLVSLLPSKLSCTKSLYTYLSFFTTATYTSINLSGRGFCASGRIAEEVTEQYKSKISRAITFSTILVFMSKVVISICTTAVAYFVLKIRGVYDAALTNTVMKSINSCVASILYFQLIFLLAFLLTNYAAGSFESTFEAILTTYAYFKHHKKNCDNKPLINALDQWFIEEEKIQEQQ